MVIGGNAEGIYAFAVDGQSAPGRQGGLLAGDQILKVNGVRVHGLTREDASAALRAPAGLVSLVVRRAPERCKAVASTGGAGDSFLVRAHFNHDTMKVGMI